MKYARHGYCVNGKVRPEYLSWHNAKRRCTDPSNDHYPNYGGRGITMCDEWLNDFSAFIAHMGPRPPGYTLDRRDNNRGYEPGNCRWATKSEQAFNRRKARQNPNRRRPPPQKISDADALFMQIRLIPKHPEFGVRGLARMFDVNHTSVLLALKRKIIRPPAFPD
jgi:hypothetical protein